MKTLIGFILIFCLPLIAFSQQGKFWGTTYGSFGDGGRIYKFNADGTNPTVVKTFDKFDAHGSNAESATLIVGSDNKLYGVNTAGGKNNEGTLFSINQSSGAFTKLYDFKHDMDIEEQGPFGGIVEGSDGYIYGYRAESHPLIYKVRKDGTDYTDLTAPWTLRVTNTACLVKANDGNLYGVVKTQSVSDKGFVFQLTTAGTFTKIYEFPSSNSENGSPIQASDGKLWTSISSSGPKLFSIGLNGANPTTYDIPGTTASDVLQDVLINSGTTLYGTIKKSNEYRIYSIGTNGTGYVELTNIGNDAELKTKIAISGDDIYGVARNADTPGANWIFKIKTNGTGYTGLKILTEVEGYYPGGVTLGDNNILYVQNQNGASTDLGNIIKIKTDGGEFAEVKNFYIKTDGMIPGTHLVLLPGGELLGVAATGGGTSSNGYQSGVLFKIGKDDSYHVLFEFDGVTTGSVPFDAPIPGPDNFYYGVTTYGGEDDKGVFYKIKADGTGFVKLMDFASAGSYNPTGGLVLAGDRFYGMTTLGGSEDYGVLYGVDADGANFEALHDFTDQVNFQRPVYHDDGFLYACGGGGTNGDGNLFKIKPDGSGYSQLFDVGETDLRYAGAEPFFDDDGNILVVITRGGANDNGGIVRVEPNGSYSIIHEWNITYPTQTNMITNGDLALGPDGLIYGLEPNGGELGTGTVFKMNADGSDYTRIELDLAGNPVAYMMPWRGLLFVPFSEKLEQTIQFAEPDAQVLGGPDLELNATASSGLEVAYTTTSENISIEGSTVSFLAAGRVTITASQDGDETYEAAAPVEQSFCVNPPKPTITTGGTALKPALTSSNSDGNQWYLDGTAIGNATGKVYEVTASGVYTVRTTADDCASAVSEQQPVSITGFNEHLDPSVEVYPNPASSHVFVRTNQQSVVSIVDVTGRIIGEYTVYPHRDHKLDIESLNKGLYILRIETPEYVTTRRISKL